MYRYILAALMTYSSLTVSAHGGPWEVEGVPKEFAANIMKTLQLKTHISQDREEYTRKKIHLAMKPLGYYSSKVYINNTKKIIRIDPGPAVRIVDVTVVDENQRVTPPNSKQYLGEIFTTSLFYTIKEESLSEARKHGFLRAKITESKAVVDPINHTATINIHLNRGAKYHVKNISLSPPTYHLKTITPYMTLKRGEIFTRKMISQLQMNLNSSGLFKSSYISPSFDDEKHTVDIAIINSPPPRALYTLGLGIDSRTGLSATSQQAFLLNKYAHKIFSDIGIANKLVNGELTYHIPSYKYRYAFTELGAKGEYFTETPAPDDNEFTFFVRRSNSWGYVELMGELNYVFKRSRFDKSADYQDQLIPAVVLRSKIPFFEFLKPTIKLKTSMSKQGILSDNTFLQARGTIGISPRIGPIIFSNQLTVGRTFHDQPLSDIWLYRTGGSYSIRGYSYDSIGPGDHLMLLRSGLFYSFMSSFSAGPIYDAGDTGDSFKLYYKSYGLAANWHSPVGNMQAFVARPTDKSTYHIGLSLYS